MADPLWHFEANDIFNFDGDFLDEWISKDFRSSNFIQNVSSKRPIYRQDFRNGNDVIEFRSNYNHHMTTEELGDDRLDLKDSFTTVVVCKTNPSQDDHVIQSWQYLNSDDYMWEQQVDSKKVVTKRKSEVGEEETSVVSVDDVSGWKIHISRHSKNTIQQYTNGSPGLEVRGSFIDLYEHTQTSLGARIGSELDTLDGYIAEFMVFDEKVSKNELQKIQSNLSNKYGISVIKIS